MAATDRAPTAIEPANRMFGFGHGNIFLAAIFRLFSAPDRNACDYRESHGTDCDYFTDGCRVEDIAAFHSRWMGTASPTARANHAVDDAWADPVLASDVQIERPANADEDEVRFALTAEAGLNDALAFPFVHLAIAASIAGFGLDVWKEWAISDIAVRGLVGIVVGIVLGKLLGKAIYKLPSGTRLSRTGDGFVALGATLIVYALTEYLHGYGFLAVFLAGLSLRRAAGDDEYNVRLHDFADETERLIMMILLVCFGGMIIGGGLLQQIGWSHVLFALLALLIVRPIIGWLSMTGIKRSRRERFIISFFGIRGLGSVFYLAFALNHGEFGNGNDLWPVVSLVIIVSIVLHGVVVTPMMRQLEKKQSN